MYLDKPMRCGYRDGAASCRRSRRSATTSSIEPGVGKTGANGHSQRGRRSAGAAEASDHEEEKRAVAMVMRTAEPAGGQVQIDGGGLFRRKLAIQIFPQPIDDFGTFHSRVPSPRVAALFGRRYALMNSALPSE